MSKEGEMPKERVYAPLAPFGDDDPAVTVVEVSWNREAGHVQLVSRMIDRVTHETAKLPVRTLAERELEEPLTWADGCWANLDRRGINDLIKYLRRARDQAFGRDE